jgi:integrase/recombinase XerD
MISSRDAEIIGLWVEKYPNPYTRYCYRLDSERLLKHAKKSLPRIILADLQNFAQKLTNSGLAPISRVRTLAAVKSLFAFCVRMRYLDVNPAAELELPAYENRLAERIVTEDDVLRMLAAETDPRDKTLVRLLYAAGLRVSEACGLCWRNLHARGDSGQITVFVKNGRARLISSPGSDNSRAHRRPQARAGDFGERPHTREGVHSPESGTTPKANGDSFTRTGGSSARRSGKPALAPRRRVS